MTIASPFNQRRITVDQLDLEGDVILTSKTVRNYSVMMDNTLTMMDHINHVRKSGFYYLSWIWKVRNCLSEEATKSIVHALVISKIDYCNGILVNLPDCAIEKLQKLMNTAARIITRHSSPPQNNASLEKSTLATCTPEDKFLSSVFNVQRAYQRSASALALTIGRLLNQPEHYVSLPLVHSLFLRQKLKYGEKARIQFCSSYFVEPFTESYKMCLE